MWVHECGQWVGVGAGARMNVSVGASEYECG